MGVTMSREIIFCPVQLSVRYLANFKRQRRDEDDSLVDIGLLGSWEVVAFGIIPKDRRADTGQGVP
jgi:hypothetical protein